MLNCTLTPDKIDPEHRIVEQEGNPTTAPKQEHFGCRSSIPTEDEATAAEQEEEEQQQGTIERTKRMTTHQPAVRITSGEHGRGHRNIMIPVDDTEVRRVVLIRRTERVIVSGIFRLEQEVFYIHNGGQVFVFCSMLVKKMRT